MCSCNTHFSPVINAQKRSSSRMASKSVSVLACSRYWALSSIEQGQALLIITLFNGLKNLFHNFGMECFACMKWNCNPNLVFSIDTMASLTAEQQEACLEEQFFCFKSSHLRQLRQLEPLRSSSLVHGARETLFRRQTMFLNTAQSLP